MSLHALLGTSFVSLVILLASRATVQTILLDDFAAGIDPRWFPIDTNVNLNADGTPGSAKPWGPGVFDPAGGALHLRTTGPVPHNLTLPPGPNVFDMLNSGFLALGWGPSLADATFSHGRIRAVARVDNLSNVDLILRANPATFSGYVFAALGSYGQFRFSRLDNGLIMRDELVPGPTFAPGENWMMEFGAIGNELSMKAWKAGEAEPATPQFTAIDNTYALGALGVSASISTNNISAPTPVNATFDNIAFTPIPEPASLVLGGVALASLLGIALSCRVGRSRRRSTLRLSTRGRGPRAMFVDPAVLQGDRP